MTSLHSNSRSSCITRFRGAYHPSDLRKRRVIRGDQTTCPHWTVIMVPDLRQQNSIKLYHPSPLRGGSAATPRPAPTPGTGPSWMQNTGSRVCEGVQRSKGFGSCSAALLAPMERPTHGQTSDTPLPGCASSQVRGGVGGRHLIHDPVVEGAGRPDASKRSRGLAHSSPRLHITSRSTVRQP